MENFDPKKNYSENEWKEWKTMYCPSSRKRKLEEIKKEVIKSYAKEQKKQEISSGMSEY
jgi:hypothetical protein